MWFQCEQPFLSVERCLTSRKTAAKETTEKADMFASQSVIYVAEHDTVGDFVI